nr:ribonuclease H-like domain, reverse transcriptase, RNA-dependent DNA polymerase [Tanacetum cinerariifolium]
MSVLFQQLESIKIILEEPKRVHQALKDPSGLKLCRRSFFNSRCKSAFLYGIIEEEVYVYQPLGFEDLDYPDKVYKVVKALYGLHQAPKAFGEWFSERKD